MQFPKGYLKKAYELIRENGGVCIADEVQTGFGRTGDHFWGFENHGVVPDIVTMAKGIGNGFPLAAVVTTPSIAKCLTQALHFNTFGGNPMASAVGLEVLRVNISSSFKCIFFAFFKLNVKKIYWEKSWRFMNLGFLKGESNWSAKRKISTMFKLNQNKSFHLVLKNKILHYVNFF